MWRLDIFEGQEYERRKVKVRVLDEGVGDGEDIEVDTYVWVAEEERLEEGEWDFAVFTKEKMGRWVAENEEYDGELLKRGFVWDCSRLGGKILGKYGIRVH